MVKEYQYNGLFKVALVATMLICIYGAYYFGKSYGFVVTFILAVSFVWFALIVLKYKIVVTEEYIVADLSKLGKRIERSWDQIYRVSRLPFSFLWMYRIQCRDKPNLTFTNLITNYKDLLREIIERSPNAIVDDSVKKLLEKEKKE